MSRKAMLSLWGLYTYNDELFSGINVPVDRMTDPDNPTPVFQLQDLVDNILLELAELEVLYTNPTFMQQAITAWAKKQLPVWQELTDTLFYEYDPIENYYRHEDWTDTLSAGQTHTTTYTPTTTDTTTYTPTTSDTRTYTPGATDTTTNSVTGYNGSSFADHDKSVLAHTGFDTDVLTHTGYDTTAVSHTGYDTTAVSHTGYDTTAVVGSGKDTNTRKGYARGNIGVMSTQQMIEMQRDVVKFNIMDYIIDDFKGRFLVLVY